MGKYLSLEGLATIWSKISPHLLPVTQQSDVKKVLIVNSQGNWEKRELTEKEDTSNKVTSISSSSTDTQYPSAKCMYTLIGDIESVLDAIINGT